MGRLDQWFIDEKARLKHNKLLMLKELKAASRMQENVTAIKKDFVLLDKLPDLEVAQKIMIDYFDRLDKELNIKAISLPKANKQILFMDVKLFYPKIDAKRLEEVIRLQLPFGMTEIRYFNFTSSSLEVMMRWHIPFKEGS